jgi:hypothetical protein
MNRLNQTEPATFSILPCWAFFRDSVFIYSIVGFIYFYNFQFYINMIIFADISNTSALVLNTDIQIVKIIFMLFSDQIMISTGHISRTIVSS